MNKTNDKSSSKASSKNSGSRFAAGFAIVGLCSILLGAIFYSGTLYSLIDKVIAQKLILAEGSESFESWKSISIPIYYRYYFFNVSNAVEIEKNGAKPQLREIGPFTYRSKWTKNPIVFGPNGTVTFRERKTMYFVPELSVFSDRDKSLVTVNGPLAVTLALLQKAPLVVRNIVSLGLSGIAEGFFVRRSARELLFEGYPEVLTSFGPILNPSLPNTRGRFAWMYGKNDTDEGEFTVTTGANGPMDRIVTFNGESEISHWKSGTQCASLQDSTDGQIVSGLAPTSPANADLSSNDGARTFTLFHPDICRTIRFVSERQRGDDNSEPSSYPFPVEKFYPEARTLASVDEYSGNSCYSSKITPSRPELGDLFVTMRQSQQRAPVRYPIRPFVTSRSGRLFFKSGVFDLSSCKYGAPVLMSYPHFLHAHPSYRENVAGLSPDPDKHQFFMTVEPRTGTSVQSRARIQINVFISKPPWISRYRFVPEIVFPVFWQELSADMSDRLLDRLAFALITPYIGADIFSLILIFFGLVSLGASLVLALRSSLTPSSEEDLTTAAETAKYSSEKSNPSKLADSISMQSLSRKTIFTASAPEYDSSDEQGVDNPGMESIDDERDGPLSSSERRI